MATNQEPRTKNQEQRTKRKYTVSDKVRAANRINSAKARSVDKEIRYRRTPKRLAANRASLVKARYVRDQLRAADLRKSAVRAGESQEEYDRHIELVEQALPAEGERQRNGVRASPRPCGGPCSRQNGYVLSKGSRPLFRARG